MILKQDNVFLRRVKEKDIEMIRNWRNDPKISQYMSFHDYITPQMQKKWFEKINNENNYFFIINIDGIDMGLIDIKNIDYKDKGCEGGIFIYNDSFQNSIYPYISSYLSINFAFNDLGLEVSKIEVLDDNKRAIRYNKSLGYKPTNIITNNLRTYILTKQDWEEAKNIIEVLIKPFGYNHP